MVILETTTGSLVCINNGAVFGINDKDGGMAVFKEFKDKDVGVPGGVYLCQVSEDVSCGACCGLYNVADASRNVLRDKLDDRSREFAKTPREVAAILAFGSAVLRCESQDRPYPEFHHCPYLGLVGKKRSRVGCLLHPFGEGNAGIDFRGLSYYGGMACRTYFCTACKTLNPVYKQALRGAADDWHAYGLIVTEAALVEAFFHELEKRVERSLESGDILGDDDRERVIRDFIETRRDWPFRAIPGKLGSYFFEDQIYLKSRVDYARATGDTVASRLLGSTHTYDALFQELESFFDSNEALAEASRIFDRLFDRLVRMIRTSPRKDLQDG